MRIGPITLTFVLMVTLLASLGCDSPDYPLDGTAWQFESEPPHYMHDYDPIFFDYDGTWVEWGKCLRYQTGPDEGACIRSIQEKGSYGQKKQTWEQKGNEVHMSFFGATKFSGTMHSMNSMSGNTINTPLESLAGHDGGMLTAEEMGVYRVRYLERLRRIMPT